MHIMIVPLVFAEAWPVITLFINFHQATLPRLLAPLGLYLLQFAVLNLCSC